MSSQARAIVSAALGLAFVVGGVLLLVTGPAAPTTPTPDAYAVLNAIVVWSFGFAGLVAWDRWPRTRVGPLMIWAGATWFLSALQVSDWSLAFTIGILASSLPLGSVSHLVLAFPDGRLGSLPARVTVAAGYLAALVQVAGAVFVDPSGGGACGDCPRNLLLADASAGTADAIFRGVNGLGIAVALSAVVILVARWHRASEAARRLVTPVLGAGVVAAGVAAVSFAASVSGSDATNPARLATFAAIALVPLAFLAVLLRIRLAQAAIGRLVVDLSGAPAPGRLREAIARALGDPSLELVYWSRGGNCYVDAHGRRVELPQGGGRAATVVEREGRHVGALVHDPSLVEQRALVDGVVAAAGLALENERLTAELRERLAELRESEERLRALIDASPIAIIELDLAGNVVLWNDAAERLFGWTREEVAGRPYPNVPEEIGVETEDVWSRVFGGEAVVVETVRRRKDGSLVDVELTSAPIRDAGGAVIGTMGILADVTERRRAQEELRRERDFTTALIDSAPALIVVLDREGRFVRFNRACEQLTGYSRDEVLGRPFWELFIQREEAPPIREALARVWSGDYPADNENYWVLRDGSRRLIAWSNTALTDAEGNVEFIVSSGLDITDRKRIEEELRASRARIVEAADAARRKLERNLHDGAQQRLVALSLALRMAQAQVAKSPEAAEAMLASASEELSQALEDLRELARGIHPAVLIDRGLPAALDALATRSPVPVEVRVELEERLPSPVEVAAYYVVSEALANVAKYAQASAVSVSVARENGVALVQVADDGVGGADPARGSGLRGIADRVEALDGRLELTSVPGPGTRLCVRIPVRDEPVRS